jgi:hypothetical protein
MRLRHIEVFKHAQPETQPITKDYFDAKLKAEIEVAKSEAIKWIVGLAIAQIGLLVGLLIKLRRPASQSITS